MKCNDCGKPCRNHCSVGSHGYCATCRDASGYAICAKCRAKKQAARQQSKAAQQQSRQVQASAQAPAYTPPPALAAFASPGQVAGATPPVSVLPPAPKRAPRTPIYLMPEAEFETWRQKTVDALQDTKARAEAYLSRRRANGRRTSTDIGMEKDQVLYEDLAEALQELRILRDMADVDQSLRSNQGHSGNTGMLLLYDDGKIKP